MGRRVFLGAALVLWLAACREVPAGSTSALPTAPADDEPSPSDSTAPPGEIPLPPLHVVVEPAHVRPVFADEPALQPPWQAFRAWRLDDARAGFSQFLQRHPEHALAPAAHLVLATILERAGARAEAARHYAAAAPGLELTRDLARYKGARAALAAGEAATAAELAAALEPDGRFGVSGAQLRAQALRALERPEEVAEALLPAISRAGDREASRLRLALAESLEAAGALEDAATRYRDVLLRHPGTEVARAAQQRLQAVRRRLPAPVWRVLEAGRPLDALLTAQADLVAHRSAEVVSAMSALLGSQEVAPGQPAWCDATWLLARAHTKLRRHEDAASAYVRFLDGCPEDERAVDARLAGGRGAFTKDAFVDALRLLSQVWTEHPEHAYADDALYMAARVRQQLGQPEHARALIERLLARYPDGDMAANAHWLRFSEHYTGGRLEAAVAYDVEAAERAERERYHRGRIRYFQARALEQLGRGMEAADVYHEVVARHPMGYYALLALNRLHALLGEAFDAALAWHVDTHRLSPVIPREVAATRHYQEAIELLRMGLGADAWWPFDHAAARAPERAEYMRGVAELYRLAGDSAFSDSVLRRELSHLEGEWPWGADARRFDLVYPREYAELVSTWAVQRAVPASLVFAIAREESRFDPRAESWANACGLMQILPSTGQGLAKDDGLRGRITCRRLFDPKINVRLGTRYLADLRSRYGGHLGLAVAAYNAGPGNLEKWPRDVPFDLWVEQIPFGQTRHYVKRVLPALWVYQWTLAGADAPWSARVPYVPLGLK